MVCGQERAKLKSVEKGTQEYKQLLLTIREKVLHSPAS